jgi:hypothetical protein
MLVAQFPSTNRDPADMVGGEDFLITSGAKLVANRDAFEFYIDVIPGCPSADVARTLDLARLSGLEVIDPDEDEPEILDDGTIRIWLTVADGPDAGPDPYWPPPSPILDSPSPGGDKSACRIDAAE